MLALIATALQVGGSIYSGLAQQRAARANRRFAEQSAQDVETRGADAVLGLEREYAALLGRQRVAGAAQGLDVNQGSLATIRGQTQALQTEDVADLRESIRREAWGIRTQGAINYRAGMAGAVGSFAQAAGAAYENRAVLGQAGREFRTMVNRVPDAWQSFLSRRRMPTGTTVLRPMGGV